MKKGEIDSLFKNLSKTIKNLFLTAKKLILIRLEKVKLLESMG